MRINKYIAVASAVLSLGFSSCGDDFLEKNPPLAVTEDDIYGSETLIDATMNGVYSRFKNGSFGGGALAIIGDNRSDDFVNTGNNNYNHAETYLMTVGANNVINPNVFQAAYLAINAANTFKENLEKRSLLPIDEKKRSRYIANCLFIRDLSWYYLSQIYSQPYAYNPNSLAVPIHIEAVKGPGYNNAPLWTISQIYEQILADLNSSTIAVLPEYAEGFDCTVPSQAAAHMLRQRIYMAELKWQEAIEEGEAVNGFTLSSSVAEMFDAPYHTNENIFSMPFTNTERGGSNPAGYFSKAAGYTDTLNMRTGILTYPGYKLPTDRRTAFITRSEDNREVWYEKYNEYSVRLEWIHIFRYAETLLNLSESYFNVGNEAKAAELLNTVRSRSIAEDDVINVLELSGDKLREAIYNERRVEFLGEGMRGLDITRRAENFVHPLATQTNGKWDTVVVATPDNKTTYCWALPEYEVQVNGSANN